MCLGIPGQVVEVTDAEKRIALVDVGGIKRPINLACVVEGPEAMSEAPGMWVLVHVGFAMSRINEEEAHKTLELLQELGELQEEMRNAAAQVA